MKTRDLAAVATAILNFQNGRHWKLNAAHKETSAQNIVRRKHHVPVHGVPSTAIIVPNYVRYDAKTSLDY